ncbi:type I pantothenate kinase [Shouchella clausii]|uniref:Pantothenate kinase n=1 Tax=Shouchella rhizosphaerae TaxID=866786 RepID=A0ABZ2CVU2_9BACI|nr:MULTISPECIES: type I pantothenate kinase [Shouchella]ALA54546.1 Pantothenate kinase [Shouchella clausii]MBU3232349.1 type I pantothenate kinase [Shouchella clausii]MBU3263384.1 type I pantothenate kinase [Shouchella clausii]MBU3505849.1 type I pantothenate kinase [Shouchella clausii]MBU3534520.1 type I pantothenate kinase [Shouchella clausii]
MTTDELTKSLEAFTHFTRAEWAQLNDGHSAPLTEKERKNLEGIYETISEAEVNDVYMPLSELLYKRMVHNVRLHDDLNRFLKRERKRVPFVIGIAGSVAVGKSTTARLIQALASRWPGSPKVELVTTDGFLYPNEVLEERGLMKRKGFPESYDIRSLLTFLTDLKAGTPVVKAPMYSHLTYNIEKDHIQTLIEPDVVIVEGINVLQVNRKGKRMPHVFVSDFFDFSIYVDAEEKDILSWYIERFQLLRNTAFQKPESYFHRYRDLTDEEAVAMAESIWHTINGVNLEKNIKPTRLRADLILTKGAHHRVEQVQLRK